MSPTLVLCSSLGCHLSIADRLIGLTHFLVAPHLLQFLFQNMDPFALFYTLCYLYMVLESLHVLEVVPVWVWNTRLSCPTLWKACAISRNSANLLVFECSFINVSHSVHLHPNCVTHHYYKFESFWSKLLIHCYISLRNMSAQQLK